jgi:hypothetical protein
LPPDAPLEFAQLGLAVVTIQHRLGHDHRPIAYDQGLNQHPSSSTRTRQPEVAPRRPSRSTIPHKVAAAHQEITRQWWAARDRFDLFVSRAVVAESRRGDAKAAARRLRALRGMSRLAAGSSGARLAEVLLRSGALPRKAEIDAAHVGVAADNGIDYLLTSNLRHLANAVLRGKIEEAVRSAGFVPPVICTPEELMEAKP